MINKRELRRKRKKQLRINSQLKRRLYKGLFLSSCYYCKQVFFIQELTIEHIVPHSFGGTNDDANITLACAPCNQKKGRESWFLKKKLGKEKYKHLTKDYNNEYVS